MYRTNQRLASHSLDSEFDFGLEHGTLNLELSVCDFPVMKRRSKMVRLDRRYIWHPFTQMRDWMRSDPTVIISGRGSLVRDVRGKSYLDANASIWTNIHGHRHPELDRALLRQLKKIAHCSSLGLASEPASLLAERLVTLAPKSLKKVFYSDDGSTAVEAALKMVHQAWVQRRQKRSTFLGLRDAYHGDTVGAMSVGDSGGFHAPFQSLMFKTEKVMAPYCYRCPYNRAKPERADARTYRKCNVECVSHLEKSFEKAKRKPFAGAIIEPLIQGAAGMIAHPHGYLKRFATLCREHRVPLIVDEVMTGLGRTGTLFACEQESVLPDVMCLAKGLTGGYMPLAATLSSQRIFDAFLGRYAERKTFFHGHSYTGNPLGCAVALENLKTFPREKTLLRVVEGSIQLETMLQSLWNQPHVGDIRRVGLIAGVELVQDWKSRKPYAWKDRVGGRVCEEAKKLGVLTRPIGNVLVIMPPLCVTTDQLETIVSVLKRSIRKVCGE